jgi:hypothetical protein
LPRGQPNPSRVCFSGFRSLGLYIGEEQGARDPVAGRYWIGARQADAQEAM